MKISEEYYRFQNKIHLVVLFSKNTVVIVGGVQKENGRLDHYKRFII